MTEGKPPGGSVLLSCFCIFEELVGGRREFLEPGLVHRRDAIIHQVAPVTDRNVDPFRAASLAVTHRRRYPTAVFLAEIVCDVGHFEAFLREEMRQRIEAPE